MLFAAVHKSVIGTKRHSRHRNILSAFGQERTLTINTPDRISERPPRGGFSIGAHRSKGDAWLISAFSMYFL
jgi:hypothetical protein